jgi:class 3 adenylate cyclase/pimeloyl-ACP methyl ester carboxylesterase
MELRMQYATASDGTSIAFGIAGSGPYLVRTPAMPFSHVQLDWRGSAFYERLTKLATVVVYDSRGTGLSDRTARDLSLEARISDLEAVVEHLGLERFALHGVNFSSPLAITYSVRHPERVSHLILDDAFARTADVLQSTQGRAMGTLAEDWDGFIENLAWLVTQESRERTEQYATFLRACVTKNVALRLYTAMGTDDVTELLPRVETPTLVLHHERVKLTPFVFGQQLAAAIPHAEMITLAGSASDDIDAVLHSIGTFIGSAGDTSSSRRTSVGVRAVLVTDLVDHTEMMQRLGDEAGRGVLREHERITRGLLNEHGGTEVKTMGDGFMASFTSVAEATACAVALQRAFATYSEKESERLRVRMGLAAGEPIDDEGDLFGSTVILASRIARRAGAGEILITEAMRGLLSGKRFLFADRGKFVPKGFEDAVRLYEVQWGE